MSQITKTSLTFALLLLLSVVTIAGCGSSNSQSAFDSSTGKHPAGWLPAGHKSEAVVNLDNCTQCHGADYKGGISKVSCTNCHIGNQKSIHPTAWGPFTDVLHATFVRSEGTSTCANLSCHGAALTGITGSGPSCTLCHLGGVNSFHPAAWGASADLLHKNYVRVEGTTGCATASCHGIDLAGTGGTGPSCTLCHLGGVDSFHPTEWGTSVNLLHKDYVRVKGTTGCATASCHGIDLAGTGGTGPSCTLCHLGGVASIHPVYWGSYTYAVHANYTRTNGTTGCSNASCHGATLTGVSDSGPSCTLCHLGGVNLKHPAAWTADIKLHKGYVAVNGDSSCRNVSCHGANLEGTFMSGPSCKACHN